MPDPTLERLAAAAEASDVPDHALQRERLAQQMFGLDPEPVRFGRFVLLEKLGQGGEGAVYSAYDPQLQRRVALKLLRPGRADTAHARARMLREAQALARLTHPNVVTVHDAGLLEDRVFIVMEYVVGHDLRRWVSVQSRTWRAVVSVYLEAARGLAAAHAIGLVHRDFKPDNAVLGEDGRLRVLDFGLARGVETEAGSQTDPLEGERDALVSLTATGALLGTPAYMAPEQFSGGHAGPQADQYAFCVSLYEALYGARPFSADSIEGLRHAVLCGELPSAPRGAVPRWLHESLVRGLAREPADRHPSMDSLVQVLGRSRQKVRRRVLTAAGLSCVAAVSAAGAWQARGDAVVPCEGAQEAYRSGWGDRRSALEQRLSSLAGPYAQEVGDLVQARLEDYEAAWTAGYTDACVRHIQGALSDGAFERRMLCLDERRLAVIGAADVVAQTDAASLPGAADVVARLPSLRRCEQDGALAEAIQPPADAALAAEVDALRAAMIRTRALEHAGRLDEALEAATAIEADAQAVLYPPSVVEASLLRGRILLLRHEYADAMEPLRRAMLLGLETGMHAAALEALARHVYVEGLERPGSASTLREVEMGEALAKGASEAGFEHALLLNNAGVVHMARGERDEALSLFSRAAAAVDEAGIVSVELDAIDSNLAMLTPDAKLRETLSRRAVDRATRALGPSHPETLNAKLLYTYYVRGLDEALRVRTRTCARILELAEARQGQPEARDCYYHLGMLAAVAGQHAQAVEAFAVLQGGAPGGTDAAAVEAIVAGLRHLYAHEALPAIEALRGAVTVLSADDAPWWTAESRAFARWLLADAYRHHGDRQAEVEQLRAALEDCDRAMQMNFNADPRRLQARTAAALAHAVGRTDEGIVHMRQAAAWYAETANAQGLAEAEAWLTETATADP